MISRVERTPILTIEIQECWKIPMYSPVQKPVLGKRRLLTVGESGQDDKRVKISNNTYFHNMYTKTELYQYRILNSNMWSTCVTKSDKLSVPSSWKKRCFNLIIILVLAWISGNTFMNRVKKMTDSNKHSVMMRFLPKMCYCLLSELLL